VVVPGSGTFGMEAVARQFATGKKCLVVRNGWFSFRWTQILKCSILFKFKAGENFNHRHTLSISRIKILA